MLYSFLHLLLLLGATLGVWQFRGRVLLVVAGLLLFPLPAALYNYLAAPVPAVVATMPGPADPSADCAKETQSASPTEDRGDVKADCAAPSGEPRVQTLAVVLMVNYLTVFLAFGAVVLSRRRPSRR